MHKVRLPKTVITRNAKTGPIPAFMSERATCPPSCKLRGNGCYAENFPMVIRWDKVSENGTSLAEVAKAIIASGATKFRAFTAGDIPHKRGRIDEGFFAELLLLAKRVPMIAYTHHDVQSNTKRAKHNRDLIRIARGLGVAVNSSADDWRDVDWRMERRLPVVAVLPEGTTESVKTPAGNTIRVCPATLPASTVTCANCKMCQNPDRSYAIGFPAHGTRRRVINIAAV